MTKIKDVFKKLISVVDFVMKSEYSDFYRNKFIPAGFDAGKLKKPADWNLVPFLTKDELIKTHPFDRIYCPLKEVDFFRDGSGTTSKNITYLCRGSISDFSHIKKAGGRRLLCLIRPTPIMTMHEAARRLGMFSASGDYRNLEKSADLVELLNLDFVSTTPHILILFGKVLSDRRLNGRIRVVEWFGETLSRPQKKLLRKLYPKALILSNYGLTEVGSMGFTSCAFTRRLGFYHLLTDRYFVEIVEPESGKPVPLGEEGEIVVTTLSEKVAPFIRYRTGDAGRLLEKKCRCGDFSSLLQVRGRIVFDRLRIPGGELRAQIIDGLLREISGQLLPPLWRVRFSEQSEGKVLKTRIILEIAAGDYAPEEQRIFLRSVFLERLRIGPAWTLKDAVEKQMIAFDLEILPRLPLAYKWRRFIRES